MTRTSTAEKRRRIAKVVKLLLLGTSRESIIQIASEKWGVSERTVDSYLHYAREKVREASDADIEYEKGMAKQRLEDLYQRALTKKDYSTARLIEKDRRDFFGLDAPKRTDITSGGEKISIEITYA